MYYGMAPHAAPAPSVGAAEEEGTVDGRGKEWGGGQTSCHR